jgi:copper chaperone CopZ
VNTRKLALLLLFSSVVVPVSKAQVQRIEMRVEGMTCNFCAFGVKKHLGRQSGVQSVEVALLDGKVDITAKEDGHIAPAQLLKATYDSGVTVAQMDMTARGRIVKDSGGNFTFQVEPNQSFAIAPNDLLKSMEPLMNSLTMVTIYGELYRKPAGEEIPNLSAPLKLLILNVQKKE